MIRTWIHRIRAGKESQLRSWLAQLNARGDEVRESFAAAGIRAEQAFILPGAAGSLLIYVSEAADPDEAARVYAVSELAIDVEHRRVLDECIDLVIEDPPAYDVAA